MKGFCRFGLLIILFAVGAGACAGKQVVAIEPADVMYARGVELREPGRFLFWKRDRCDQAIAVFQQLIDTYPFSRYAVSSQLGVADCYFQQGRWQDAIFHYREFESLYPTHAEIARVRFSLAESYREQSLAYDRDTADLEQALNHYQRTARLESPYREEALEWVAALRSELARRILYIGRFYERENQPLSALERYEALLVRYADTPESLVAHDRASGIYRRLGEAHKIETLPQPQFVPEKS